jgi:hypothetical protein
MASWAAGSAKRLPDLRFDVGDVALSVEHARTRGLQRVED